VGIKTFYPVVIVPTGGSYAYVPGPVTHKIRAPFPRVREQVYFSGLAANAQSNIGVSGSKVFPGSWDGRNLMIKTGASPIYRFVGFGTLRFVSCWRFVRSGIARLGRRKWAYVLAGEGKRNAGCERADTEKGV